MVGEAKAARLAVLNRQSTLAVVVDHPDQLAPLRPAAGCA